MQLKEPDLYKCIVDAGCKLDRKDFEDLILGIAASPKLRDSQDYAQLFVPDPECIKGKILRSLINQIDSLRSSIDIVANFSQSRERLERLRAYINSNGLSGFILPRSDEYLGEYIALNSERVSWLTGFTGSAGLVVVLSSKAVIFVDGRYTLQLDNEVDANLFERKNYTQKNLYEWFLSSLASEDVIGYDPKLHSRQSLYELRKACKIKGAHIKSMQGNPIDILWEDQPRPPLSPVYIHDLKYSGQSVLEKCSEVRKKIITYNADAAMIVSADSLAWLLNIRGGDVPNCPLALGFAIINQDGLIKLFMDKRKIPPKTLGYIQSLATVHHPDEISSALKALGQSGQSLLVDITKTPEWFEDQVTQAGGGIIAGTDPCTIFKAIKNHTELSGARSAHVYDGVALTRFLHWLDNSLSGGVVDELSASKMLEGFRLINSNYRYPSFDTISGYGPNGAIIHYRVTPSTNRVLEKGSLYLVDSGAHYLNGTTDVTRTISVGEPSDEMCDRFTRVLKGHIALATTSFEQGTCGYQLDPLARQYLQEVGLDYNHGTGHGVGNFMNVHEGPQKISKVKDDVVLAAGMIVSNEPGFYKEGYFGIRIENLLAVIKSPRLNTECKNILRFETLTLAPIDKSLVQLNLMTQQEISWLNAYHSRVYDELKGFLEGEPDTLKWLEKATSSI